MFELYDQNKDGFIDKTELGRLLEALNFPATAFPGVFEVRGAAVVVDAQRGACLRCVQMPVCRACVT